MVSTKFLIVALVLVASVSCRRGRRPTGQRSGGQIDGQDDGEVEIFPVTSNDDDNNQGSCRGRGQGSGDYPDCADPESPDYGTGTSGTDGTRSRRGRNRGRAGRGRNGRRN